jgi:hypothetical protein
MLWFRLAPVAALLPPQHIRVNTIATSSKFGKNPYLDLKCFVDACESGAVHVELT